MPGPSVAGVRKLLASNRWEPPRVMKTPGASPGVAGVAYPPASAGGFLKRGEITRGRVRESPRVMKTPGASPEVEGVACPPASAGGFLKRREIT